MLNAEFIVLSARRQAGANFAVKLCGKFLIVTGAEIL
jgi:hypothetical protein